MVPLLGFSCFVFQITMLKYEENWESLTRKRENPSESSKETEEVKSRDSCQLLKVNKGWRILFSSHFNYLDYEDALFGVFFFRPVIHSSFIHFHQSCENNLQKWFQNWFEYFGIEENILPSLSLQGYENFVNGVKNNFIA